MNSGQGLDKAQKQSTGGEESPGSNKLCSGTQQPQERHGDLPDTKRTGGEDATSKTTLRGKVPQYPMNPHSTQSSLGTLNEAIQQSYAFVGKFPRRNYYDKDSSQGAIIQSSKPLSNPIHAQSFGLVSAIIAAYKGHHHLVLRPDDIWQAVLTQFGFYVLKNSEELRDTFVDFQGKRELTVTMEGTLFTADFGAMSEHMVQQIVKNIKDPTVAAWLLPDFSTTTQADRVAASVSIMSTLQNYFEYCASYCACGFPSVTLLGTLSDWQKLRGRIDRLLEFDTELMYMKAWHGMLVGILDEMVATKMGKDNMDSFWDRACHWHGGGSRGSGRSPTYLSGWATVFSVFSSKGFWRGGWPGSEQRGWPNIDTDQLAQGALEVPVRIKDNGKEYESHMFAGQFGFDAVDEYTVQPRTDWCIAISKDQLQSQ